MSKNDKDKNKENLPDKDEKDKEKDVEEEKKINEPETKDNIDSFGVISNIFDFRSDIQYMTIIGSIEGHMVLPPNNKTTKYENLIPQLVAVQENDKIKGLITILNTVGGDVEAGLALAELISTLSKPTVSLVLGGGHSIGIPLATASNYSFIAESATMTLHPIRMTGMVIGAEQTYEYFRKMQERVVSFITRTSKADRDTISKLMSATDNMANDVGTILFGKDAVKIGLIDEVGGLDKALAKLKELIVNNKKD
ncbi:ClpP family protease [Anaerovorax odorimutans]|uniref:ClpP family protease n=1 Tax=Anaerovorax odorimutans TaxID=109327 RepID=UPI00041EF2C5|nr:ATP-dependent Clp protease proteolytic subunit [Anaerovorax odorimutans]